MNIFNRSRILERIVYALAIIVLAGFADGCASQNGLMTQQMKQRKANYRQNRYQPAGQTTEPDPNAVNPYAPGQPAGQ